MAGPYLPILFILFAGLFTTGHFQQYDVEPNLEWQAGRIHRTQKASLPSFTQSSPSDGRNAGFARGNLAVEQQRPRSLSSGPASIGNRDRSTHSRASFSSENKPSSNEKRFEAPSLASLEITQNSGFAAISPDRRPAQLQESSIRSIPSVRRSRFRQSPTSSESPNLNRPIPAQETENLRQRPEIPTSRLSPRHKIKQNTAPNSSELDNRQYSGEASVAGQRNRDVKHNRLRQEPNVPSVLGSAPSAENEPRRLVETYPTQRQSRRKTASGEELNVGPKKDSPGSSQPFPAQENSQKQPELQNTRSQSRHTTGRGASRNDKSGRRGIFNGPENEVIKSERIRGRFSAPRTATARTSIVSESVSSQKQNENSYLSTTPVPPETVPVAEDPVEPETLPTERISRNRFQPTKTRAFGSAENLNPRKISRPSLTTAIPNLTSRDHDSEITRQFSSIEETQPPPDTLNNAPVTPLPADGYTDPIISSTENIRSSSRGNTVGNRGLPNKAQSPRRKTSRGEVKAQLTEMLKSSSGDEISDEDNYPKEFLEKIKTSSEQTSSSSESESAKPKLSGRFPTGRNFPTRGASRSLPKRHMDSDVSESINEEVLEQNLPSRTKFKDGSRFGRTRYFGKGKTTTTTIVPLTTKQLPSKSLPNSNVDALRQRYLDKLKQSQEERNQKLANLRPKLVKDGTKPTGPATIQPPEFKGSSEVSEDAIESSSHIPFRPTHNPYTKKNKFVPRSPPSGAALTEKSRPKFSLTPRLPETNIEAAIPTVSEYSRTKNRYSRLRKEELSVEAPEAKFWTTNNKAKDTDTTYNFIRLRTKDLTPLGSERVEESVSNNEILEAPSSSMSEKSSSVGPTTSVSTDIPLTTTLSPVVTTTMGADLVTTTMQPAVESNEFRSSMEQASEEAATTEADRITSGQTTISTDAPDEKPATTTMLQQDDPTSTLSVLNAFTSFSSSDLSISPSSSDSTIISTTLSEENISISDNSMSSSRVDSVATEVMPATTTTLKSTTVSIATFPSNRPTTSISKKSKSAVNANLPSQSMKTTTVPSFLDNRPILKNLIGLFSPTTTTTSKSIAKSKPKSPATKRPSKTTKKPGKPKTTKTSVTVRTTSVTPVTTPMQASALTTSRSENSTTNPLPLAISAEEVINDTKEVISNKTSFGSAFSIAVPRAELDALTPESFINTTESPPVTMNVTTTEMGNVTSRPVYFEYTTSNVPKRAQVPQTTAASSTTGDYYVFGIYPNNTVVKKRAWKTFDYEKYMSPYVIFGIYPNNTIVKKFPNGTIINDEFMTSDNEISVSPSSKNPPLATTPATNTPIPATASSPITTVSTVKQILTTTVSLDEDDFATTEATTPLGDETSDLLNGRSEELASIDAQDSTTTDSSESTTLEAVTSSNLEDYSIDPVFIRSGLNIIGDTGTTVASNAIDGMTTQDGTVTITPPPLTSTTTQSGVSTMSPTGTATVTSTVTPEETTVDPALNLVLPLTIEEVQTFWNGNFSDVGNDSEAKGSINVQKSANVVGLGKEAAGPISIANLAFRALSTTGTTDDSTETTTSFSLTTTPDVDVTSRKPRVKFVTLTPGVVVTTDVEGDDDAITMSSQHVQKVTKAPTQLPNDILTSVFGQLEEKASSPIPDILKDVGNEVEGDGLTAALARRIIALAMERAKSTTTESIPTTMSTTTLAATTVSPTTTTGPTTRKKQSTRTVPNAATDASQQNSIISIPVGDDLQNVLQQLLAAQNQQQLLPAVTTTKDGATTLETTGNMEKAIENQIRLAEQVRKASRTMKKKKKKKTTTTTPSPPFRLGFLFNFFNRPSSPPIPEPTRTPKKLRTVSSTSSPVTAAQLPQLLSSAQPQLNDEVEVAVDETAGGDANNRGELLTAAIDVTKAVSKFMGTVINNAAHSFQTFVRGNFWGR